MKVINTGNTYRVYDDNLKTFDAFPAQTYKISFSKQTGFFAEKYQDIENKEKIYGVVDAKADKALRSFKAATKNLGVILSGPKGMGKSLTAKLIIEKAVKSGYPVFIVDTYFPGIASYLNDIRQECIVLFDEFDKTFCGKREDRDTNDDPQTEMLTLFDGVSTGKKMFVITCNELRNLNDFLVNRPGRFHYHFRFDYPTNNEIKQYLEDNLNEKYWNEIEEVIKFASKVNLNYDCLRAIVFELQTGESFKEAIKDLNIVNTESELYNITISFENGNEAYARREEIDMFEDDYCRVGIYDKFDNWIGNLSFTPSEAKFNSDHMCYCANLKTSEIDITDNEDYQEYTKDYKSKPTLVKIKRCKTESIHYMV